MSMAPSHAQFEALVNAFSADLFRYALWLCHDAVLAEDLVQETFLRAWKALHSLRDVDAAKSWLISILRRETARHFARPGIETRPLDEFDLERIAAPEDGQGRLEHVVLRRALAELAIEYREPILLQVLFGYSCDEIARELQISTNATMTRLFRARQKLRKILEGDVGNMMEQNELGI